MQTELALLKNKQDQAETAMELALLQEDQAAFLAAQQQQLQAINDLEIRKVKINQDAQALLDKIRSGQDDQYNKQILQNQAFAEFKKSTEELGVLQQINGEQIKQLDLDIYQAKLAGNKALQDRLLLEKQGLVNQNV